MPPVFAEHYSDHFHCTRVSNRQPEATHRIIPAGVDFTDHINYTKIPIRKERSYDTYGSWEQTGPQWRVTWQCYGLTEDTIERQSQLEGHYPELFD
ncbi:hypothetical protein RHGRI_030798 [Rhododendron griersonianum]|uniref:Uncharacterized protein n=1 Tax=Rhododendron griersonianum TaxID=479676 RepID=A0AAV6I8K9_9ERIC|nr:hypothetical protein RHGRI_030798 [Rhododendron griersonianum]